MCVYDCNAILTIVEKKISYKYTKRSFTELTTHLKNCGINPGFHFMDNKV